MEGKRVAVKYYNKSAWCVRAVEYVVDTLRKAFLCAYVACTITEEAGLEGEMNEYVSDSAGSRVCAFACVIRARAHQADAAV